MLGKKLLTLLAFLSFSFIIVSNNEPQPSKTIDGTIDGQDVQYQKSQEDQIMDLEIYRVKAIDINYENIKTYSFELADKQNFVIKVNHDVQIKGIFTVYLIQNDAYSESTYKVGQEVYLTIYQDRHILLFSQNCYHTLGFRFMARKGHTYSITFGTKNTKKLISMLTQNYMTQRKGAQKIQKQHAEEQQTQTQSIKNTLKMYLGVAERNFMMNQQIAYNVTLHSKRYMSYQLIQMLLIILGACTQIYLVKRLLIPNSII